jgi:hypothetical protein
MVVGYLTTTVSVGRSSMKIFEIKTSLTTLSNQREKEKICLTSH